MLFFANFTKFIFPNCVCETPSTSQPNLVVKLCDKTEKLQSESSRTRGVYLNLTVVNATISSFLAKIHKSINLSAETMRREWPTVGTANNADPTDLGQLASTVQVRVPQWSI